MGKVLRAWTLLLTLLVLLPLSATAQVENENDPGYAANLKLDQGADIGIADQNEPGRDRSGGADAGGYYWRDSAERGVSFAWKDLTGIGDTLVRGDDKNSGKLNFGFNFPWYGANYRNIVVCSNGWASLDSTTTLTTTRPGQCPSATTPNNLLAVFAYDQRTDRLDSWCRWWTNRTDSCVVEWYKNRKYGAGDSIWATYELILLGNGTAKFQYLSNHASANGSLQTIGFENANGQQGLNIAYGQANWISANLAVGIAQRFMDYAGPGVNPTPGSLAFGTVYLNYERTLTLRIDNNGAQTLSITSLTCDDQSYVIPVLQNQVDVASGGFTTFDVIFRPTQAGDHNVNLNIHCNAENAQQGVYALAMTGTSLAAPTISIGQNAFEEEAVTGDILNRTLRIDNTGGSPLSYTTSFVSVREPRDEDNERDIRNVGPEREDPMRDLRGGPDASGYSWRDNADRLGVDYHWVDITGVGTRLNPGDDWNSDKLQFNWNFPWYGGNYHCVRAISNGYVTLDSTFAGTTYPLPQCPAVAAPNNVITPLGYDMNPTLGGSMYYWTNNTDSAIVAWINVPQYGQAGNTQTVEVIFTRNGDVKIQYASLTNINGVGQTVGFENADGTRGLNIAYHVANFLHNEYAIGISPSFHKWVNWTPTAGTINANEGIDMGIVFNATNLLGGVYQGELHINSNDPANPSVIVNVDMAVTGIPQAHVTWAAGAGYPNDLNFNSAFPDMFAGTLYQLPVTVTNSGTDVLNITNIASDNAAFTVAPTQFQLAPAASQTVTVDFQVPQDQPGIYDGNLTIESNDPVNNLITVAVHARTFLPPVIGLNTDLIEENLFTGDVVNSVVAVANHGDAEMRFTTGFNVTNEPRDVDNRDVRNVDGSVGPARDLRSDPDASGYSWRDIAEFGVRYNWVDITGVGTHTAGGDDWNSGVLQLNWLFPYYGASYHAIRACSNGWITLDSTSTSAIYTVPQCPTNTAPNLMLAANGCDLTTTNTGMWYWTNNVDSAVVSWINVPLLSNAASTSTFQIVLTSRGDVTYQYHDLQNGLDGSLATVGWENADGAQGQNIAYHVAGALRNEYAIRISNNWHSWVTWTPEAAAVAGGTSQDVTVTLNANQLFPGLYAGELHFLSNDPHNADVFVDVQINVTGVPMITTHWAASAGYPNSVDWNQAYQDLFLDLPYSIPVTISNTGTADLEINDISAANGQFAVDLNQTVLAPRQSATVTLTFQADDGQPRNDELVISSNDVAHAELRIPLHADAAAPPTISLSTDQVNDAIMTDEESIQELNVANTGDAQLRWETSFEVTGEPQRDLASRDIRSVEAGPVNEAIAVPFKEPAKGEEVVIVGTPRRDLRGQPDIQGYEWRDSDENDGPDYNWVEINQIGTHLAATDDWNSGVLDLGFEVPYYGTNYSSIRAISNGYITFDAAYTSATITLPQPVNAAAPNAALLVGNFDLNPGAGGAMYFWTDGAGTAIVEWDHVQQFGNAANLITMQVILTDRGMITYQYADLQNLNGATQNVGYESPDGSLGASIAYHVANGLRAGYAIGISNDWHNWINWEPQEGTLEMNENTDVTITFNGADLLGGLYQGNLIFSSNDPVTPNAVVGITLDVTGIPEIEVTWAPELGYPDVMDWNRIYEDLFFGNSYDATFTVKNVGTADLEVNDIQSDNATFSPWPTEFFLGHGQSQVVTVTMNAEGDGVHEGILSVFSNGANAGQIDISVRSEVFSSPVILLDQDQFQEDLLGDQTAQVSFTLGNDGGADLRWTTDFEETANPGGRDAVHRELRTVGATGPTRPVVTYSELSQYKDQSGNLVIPGKGVELNLGQGVPQLRRDNRGEPDAAGYEWRDNTENDGPDFNWVEINEVGTRLAATDDWNSGVLDLGFEVPWYGTNYNSIRVISNGYVTFDPAYTGTTISQPQPVNAAAPNALLLPANFDLNASAGGSIYFWTDNAGTAIVEWDGVQQFANAANTATFEVIIEDNGMITYQYNNMVNTDGVNQNVGYESPDGTMGASIAYHVAGSIPNGTAIGISNDWLSWFSWEPTDGTIAHHEETAVFCTFNAVDQLEGDYAGNLHIESNDPNSPNVIVSVSLHVTGIPKIEVTPAANPFEGAQALVFPDTYVNGSAQIPGTIKNIGTTELEIPQIVESDGQFFVDFQEGAVLAPGEQIAFNFFFHPSAVGDQQGTITFHTNAVNAGEGDQQGDVWFDLMGSAHLPPVIATTPGAGGLFNVGMVLGQDPVTMELAVANRVGDGGDTLWYEINTEPIENRARDAAGREIRSVEAAGPVRDRAGGPDDVTYQWRDNDEAGGPDYEWIDIVNREGAQSFELGDDGGTGLALPFSFPYYGGNYDSVFICSNGWISLVRPASWFVYNFSGWAALPNASPPATFIGPGMFDWNENNGGESWYWTDGSMAVITWNNIAPFSAAFNGNWTFQVILYPNGYCKFQYNDTDAPDGNQLVGFINEAKDRGFEILRNEAGYLVSGRAIAFGNQDAWGIPWLFIDNPKGWVLAGDEKTVQMVFTTDGLEDNIGYNGIIHINSNDPLNPQVDINVHLQVGFGVPTHFVTPENHGPENESVLVTAVNFDRNPAHVGWEIGVFTPGGVLAAGDVWLGRDLGLSVWSDDPNTQEIEGFREGEAMSFKVWDYTTNTEYRGTANYTEGNGNWTANGLAAVTIDAFSAYTCNVHLTANWNLMSINVIPPANFLIQNGANAGKPDIRLMTASVRNHLLLLKDERGRFYWPANNFSNIPYWNVAEGYQMRMDAAVDAEWTGEPIQPQTDVPISTGWNFIAYFPTYQLTCARGTNPEFLAISPILANVNLAKDGGGRFCAPRNRFSNMQPWRESLGYQINVNANVVLNYPASQGQFAAAPIVEGPENGAALGRWAELTSTGENMSVLLTSISGVKLADGDQVAAFSTDGRLVGVGTVTDGMVGLAVWGDDASTDAVDGLKTGDAFVLKYWNAKADQVTDLSLSTTEVGKGLVYKADEFTAGTAGVSASIPTSYYLGQNYPNPFNGVTRLTFGLPEDARISVRVFDLAGRVVATLVDGELKAGEHTALWNAEGVSTGIYMVKMVAPNFSDTRKVALMK